jgi:small-conductance mechanosensitive channel
MSRLSWFALVAVAIGMVGAPAGAQPPFAPQSQESFAIALEGAAKTIQVSDPPATLVYANRAIVQFRATVLSRKPETRAASAVDLLDRLLPQLTDRRVSTQAYGDTYAVRIGTQPIFVVFPADVDALAQERPEAVAAASAARLQTAIDEVVELQRPYAVFKAVGLALLATVVFVAILTVLVRVNRRVAARLSRTAERHLQRIPGGAAISRVADPREGVKRAVAFVALIAGAVATYSWLTFVLNRFPYTRPMGESLRGVLFSTAASLGQRFVAELPNLLTLVLIFLIARFFARLVGLAFQAAEEGHVALPWIYPETALPTRRIAVALVWLFALIVSYEYLPGSDSDAFKGVSVFVGLIISLGSSGVMNQAMSGLMLMYSRALRRGDFVRIGDVEGTVLHLGALSTKIKTARNEEITMPNAIVVSHATTNYSRNADAGVMLPTSVTIGYDVPWRQVHALLALAAERTSGVRREPKPVVLQAALGDFSVQYTLLVSLEQPQRRVASMAALHANIQDAFNEYGVQIMSPNYEADPDAPKVVPRNRWYSAPAVPDAGVTPEAASGSRVEEIGR